MEKKVTFAFFGRDKSFLEYTIKERLFGAIRMMSLWLLVFFILVFFKYYKISDLFNGPSVSTFIIAGILGFIFVNMRSA